MNFQVGDPVYYRNSRGVVRQAIVTGIFHTSSGVLVRISVEGGTLNVPVLSLSRTDPSFDEKPRKKKSSSGVDEMSAALHEAKLKKIQELVVERFIESASAEDAELILLMDLNVTNLVNVYGNLGNPGHKEHPVFSRNQWVGIVSSNLTDLGYWPWVQNEVAKAAIYKFANDSIVDKDISFPIPTMATRAMPSAPPRPYDFDSINTATAPAPYTL